MIGFQDGPHPQTGQGLVSLMYVSTNHRLLYRTFDPVTSKYVSLYEEPYETARDIVLDGRDSAAPCN